MVSHTFTPTFQYFYTDISAISVTFCNSASNCTPFSLSRISCLAPGLFSPLSFYPLGWVRSIRPPSTTRPLSFQVVVNKSCLTKGVCRDKRVNMLLLDDVVTAWCGKRAEADQQRGVSTIGVSAGSRHLLSPQLVCIFHSDLNCI